ncbi:MAG TPA: HlyD family secretion protein [Kofleriaceae bacterium]|nr:HlyD family secretion protein [Kofleriaceae bacterium]
MAEPGIIQPRKSKARRAYLVLATLALAVIAVYYVHGYMTRDEVTTDDAQVDADVVPVPARVGGVIVHTLVGDNQHVTADKPPTEIAEIDSADYAAKVAAASADLAAATAQAQAADAQVDITRSTSKGGLSSAQATLEGTGASVRSAQAQVAAAAAALARTQAEGKQAEDELDRAKKLHDAGAMSGQQLEAAQVSYAASKAAIDAAAANLAAAKDAAQQAQSRVAAAAGQVVQSTPVERQVQAAEANATLAHARVAAAQAALDVAKLSFDYTKIVAPVTGTTSRLAVHEGQMVQPGQTVVMIVPERSYVIANFKETQLERIKPGDPAEVTVDALGGKTFHGTVESVSPATGARFSMMPPDNATGNFVKVVQRVPVKIVWNKDEDLSQLHAGLSVEVKVFLK